MKKPYALPEIQLYSVLKEDVITTSGGGTTSSITNGGSGTGINESFGDFIGSLQ